MTLKTAELQESVVFLPTTTGVPLKLSRRSTSVLLDCGQWDGTCSWPMVRFVQEPAAVPLM